MKPAPPVTRSFIRRSLVGHPLEARAKALTPVRKARRLGLLRPEDGIRGPRSRAAQLFRRDAANTAVDRGFLEDRLRELGPGAIAVGGDVVEAVGKLHDLLR